MAVSTRERLIQAAHELFYRDGVHAVGLDRIIDTAGVTKTTFYNHFESKDDLVLEVLRWHDRWWQDTFRQLLRKHGGDDPRSQLLNAFKALDDLFTGDGFNGCMFVNVSVEFPLHHDPVHIAAKEHKHAMEDIVREIAGYAHAQDPAAFAQEFCMVLEGAYVTRQVTGRSDTSAIGSRIAQRIINDCIPS